jgi:hypothetical protein
MVESHGMDPKFFFSIFPLPQNAGRVYLLSGRSRKFADLYLSLRTSPQEFAKLSTEQETGNAEPFLYVAPLVAIALRQNGHADDARQLLATADVMGREHLRTGTALSSALLARIYAVEGRNDEALRLLTAAANRNWLPQAPMQMPDLDEDPSFASLKSDPRFRAVRGQILDRVARMKTQVHIDELRHAMAA